MVKAIGTYDQIMMDIVKATEQQSPVSKVAPVYAAVKESLDTVRGTSIKRPDVAVADYLAAIKPEVKILVEKLKSQPSEYAKAKMLYNAYKSAVRLAEDLKDTIDEIESLMR